MNEKSKSAKFHSASRHNVSEAGLPVYTEGMLKWLERQVLTRIYVAVLRGVRNRRWATRDHALLSRANNRRSRRDVGFLEPQVQRLKSANSWHYAHSTGLTPDLAGRARVL